MDDVDRVLAMASKRLIAQVADMLEASGANPVEVACLREESLNAVTFPVNWDHMLNSFHRSLYPTAHQRYCWWMRELTEPLN